MAKRILAPIDTRERAETIVPVVAALARDAGSTVRLLRVQPVPDRVIGRPWPTAIRRWRASRPRGWPICGGSRPS